MARIALLYRALALASFALYAVSTLALREEGYAQYHPENFSIATAISHVVYGAPMGEMHWEVLAPLMNRPGGRIQENIRQAATLANPGPPNVVNPDGNGFAYNLFATVALQCFGVRLSSLITAYLLLTGISALAFCLRYRDDRLSAACLYFLAMTALSYSVLTLPETAGEFAVGGMRYFALLAVLPALHLFWELMELPEAGGKIPRGHFSLAIVQLLLLLFAVLVRGSAGYTLLALAAVMLFLWRRHPGKGRRIGRKAMPLIIAAAAFLAAFHALAPAHYRHSGRVTGSVWHRVLISLGAHPEWPFGDLESRFPCARDFPRDFQHDLVPGIVDMNAYCMWAEYTTRHGIPYSNTSVYGASYEAGARSLFFAIARRYPHQALDTFLRYKPRMLWDTMLHLPHFHLPGKTRPIRRFMGVLLGLQMAVTALFFARMPARSPTPRTLLFVFGLLGLLTLPGYFWAWSTLHTCAELLLYMVAGAGALAGMIIGAIIGAMGRQGRSDRLARSA